MMTLKRVLAGIAAAFIAIVVLNTSAEAAKGQPKPPCTTNQGHHNCK